MENLQPTVVDATLNEYLAPKLSVTKCVWYSLCTGVLYRQDRRRPYTAMFITEIYSVAKNNYCLDIFSQWLKYVEKDGDEILVDNYYHVLGSLSKCTQWVATVGRLSFSGSTSNGTRSNVICMPRYRD